ncbi:MAG: carboxypeptidase regulatory-like domain-containing protein, partial [Ardenticatenales bacterium]|nr:carboxypeptidase regulatory-like domain-containing protein [Ardenticatenales bacterium]
SPPLHTLLPTLSRTAASAAASLRLRPRGSSAAPAGRQDPLLENSLSPGAMVPPLLSWDGVGNRNGMMPPDASGDVGPNHYVQWVNGSFQIWDKKGRTLYGPVAGNTLWRGFGGRCEATNHGDPIVLYDPLADRWLMSQFALSPPSEFRQCIAISQGADPLGAWHRYDFLISRTKMNDYPKFGVWPDGYYMSVNQFDSRPGEWAGAGVVAFEREQMLAGRPATMLYVDLEQSNLHYGGLLPADLDGPAPPAGSAAYFAAVDQDWHGPGSDDLLHLWEFKANWDAPGASTFRLTHQLVVAPFDWSFGPGNMSIPQPDTAQKLSVIPDRLMFRLQYRNLGSHEVLLANHTVDVNESNHAGIRWYEVHDPGGTPAIHQQGTYAPDEAHRWMGSVAMDHDGNIALGYSVSSPTLYPSVRYTGRLAGDPPGTMRQGEGTLVAGRGVQLSPQGRWGDYSALTVDPVDDCTFWYTQEYYDNSSSIGWKTRIGAFRFPTCTSAPKGALEGQVTDDRGLPIPQAIVSAGALTTMTNAEGHYRFLTIPVGSYPLNVRLYGYAPAMFSPIAVTEGMTTTVNARLAALPRTLIEGTVHDGSGAGWPLYARLDIDAPLYEDPPRFTNPVTGYYSVSLVSSLAHTLTLQPVSQGYLPLTRTLSFSGPSDVVSFASQVDPLHCHAPGYAHQVVGLAESFEANALPSGWQIVDNLGTGQGWRFDDPGKHGNLTGGAGGFAVVNSDFYGKESSRQDTELRSPAFDLSQIAHPLLQFNSDFYGWAGGLEEIADVDVSVDGGESWLNIWRHSGSDRRGPRLEMVDLSTVAGGKTEVRVRFHYYDAEWERWWQIDNARVGQITCEARAGGLLVGHVFDENTGLPVESATVRTPTGESTQTHPTPDDSAVAGAFFSLFMPSGINSVLASAEDYGEVEQPITPLAYTLQTLSFNLPAGRLASQPTALSLTVMPGYSDTMTVRLLNTGLLPANFTVEEVNAPAPGAASPGTMAPATRHLSPKRMQEKTAAYLYDYTPPSAPRLDGGAVINSFASGLLSPWGMAYDTNQGTLWVGETEMRAEGAYGFDAGGQPTRQAIPTGNWGGVFGAGMTYDSRRQTLWQVGVGASNCIHELDPATGLVSGQQLCPPVGTSQRGLAYDPTTDTFYSGSWNDGLLHRFDRAGQLLESTDVGLPISGLALNPATGHLFVLVNAAQGFDLYVLDSRANHTLLGGFDVAGLDNWEQAGLALDCEGSLWLVNQASGLVMQITSGEAGVC